jgi:thioredoxin-like negative regulator of GroEL
MYGNLIAYMLRRLDENPNDLRLRLTLVSHLEMAGRYEEAVEHANRLLYLDPANRHVKGLLLRLRLERRIPSFHR